MNFFFSKITAFLNVFLFQNFGFFLKILGLFEILTFFFFRKLRPFQMYLSPISIRRVCAKHKTFWLVHHRPLKKRDLNEARHECQGYTRGSKARRMFPSTFLLSPCLSFPLRECTVDMRKCRKHTEQISR